jgi:hypothetical protein
LECRNLERKLAEFQVYYKAARSHASLDGRTPLTFNSGQPVVPADLGYVRWVSPAGTAFGSQLPPNNEFETDSFQQR